MRYFVEFSYNGKNYFGYQIQPNEISVQEVLEKAFTTILRKPIKMTGAGRTDTGVHARKMFAHFDVENNLGDNLVGQLNSYLPKDIAIHQIFNVDENLHARFDALSRTYHYHINFEKDPFLTDFSWYHRKKLDVEKMNLACLIMIRYKDFECFSKIGSDNKTTLCDIKEARWEQNGTHLKFIITADRFLRNMVRAIVGTMVEIGSGKLEPENLHQIIQSKNRSQAGISAPAHGLFLVDVEYEFPRPSSFK